DQPIAQGAVAFGEISLAGEVRPVSAAKLRAAEAARLGFTIRLDAQAGSIGTAVAAAIATGRSARDAELDRAF
ncbi:MAG TPA: DNA repair protein RadA, partial [Cryobacterium sp.]|nr:DNA repair protein RadA [Cryobacterium sp.]